MRKTLVIVTKPPYTSEHALGGIYTALALADKGLKVTLLLIDDGVYCAVKGQRSEKVNFEDLLYTAYSSGILVLVHEDSLKKRGLEPTVILEVCRIVSSLEEPLDEYDHILRY